MLICLLHFGDDQPFVHNRWIAWAVTTWHTSFKWRIPCMTPVGDAIEVMSLLWLPHEIVRCSAKCAIFADVNYFADASLTYFGRFVIFIDLQMNITSNCIITARHSCGNENLLNTYLYINTLRDFFKQRIFSENISCMMTEDSAQSALTQHI